MNATQVPWFIRSLGFLLWGIPADWAVTQEVMGHVNRRQRSWRIGEKEVEKEGEKVGGFK